MTAKTPAAPPPLPDAVDRLLRRVRMPSVQGGAAGDRGRRSAGNPPRSSGCCSPKNLPDAARTRSRCADGIRAARRRDVRRLGRPLLRPSPRPNERCAHWKRIARAEALCVSRPVETAPLRSAENAPPAFVRYRRHTRPSAAPSVRGRRIWPGPPSRPSRSTALSPVRITAIRTSAFDSSLPPQKRRGRRESSGRLPTRQAASLEENVLGVGNGGAEPIVRSRRRDSNP